MTGGSVLVTGGTGTFGRAFIGAALLGQRWRRVIGFSRDEVKQAQLFDAFGWWDAFRGFTGDVRDPRRLALAFRGVDAVVHAAALKRVETGAASPTEMIETNVMGTWNVIEAAIDAGVRRVVVVSSDKAVQATTFYGGTKFCAEGLAVQSNSHGHREGTCIAAVRYGNVLGSRGSVIEKWRAQAAAGQPLTITSPRMTRFVMTIERAVGLVDYALSDMRGGEVFVPVLPAAEVLALAAAALGGGPLGPIVETGLRPGGEKLNEALLSEEEPSRTRLVHADTYAVAPATQQWCRDVQWPGELVASEFQYRSDLAPRLGVGELVDLLARTEALA